MLFPFGQIVEIICLFFAFRFLSGKSDSFWPYFKWFMLLTCAVEVYGYVSLIFSLGNKAISNHWMYNSYLLVEMVFKFYILYKICRNYFKSEFISIPFLIVFFVVYVLEGIENGFAKYNYISNSIASVGILICCCLYFYQFLKKEEYVDIYRHAPFWIIVGLFFFYLGSTACNVFFKILSQIWEQQHIPIRYIIFTLLTIVLYSCWSYAFLCKYRKPISSS